MQLQLLFMGPMPSRRVVVCDPQAWSKCVDRERDAGSDFTEECREKVRLPGLLGCALDTCTCAMWLRRLCPDTCTCVTGCGGPGPDAAVKRNTG